MLMAQRLFFENMDRKEEVILLVGETGTGKTTMINAIINYLLGVKFEDQEFYQITEDDDNEKEENEDEEEEEEEKKEESKEEEDDDDDDDEEEEDDGESKEDENNLDPSQSQTSLVTVYEVFVKEKSTSLTIIDTPGYGHTEGQEKDKEISEYLLRLFSDVDGVHYIDSVCFVMKASQNRLSDKELYIFHSVLSLFGRDIEENIVFLLTHSDGGPPTDALNAIKKAEIPCRRDGRKKPVHFLFNNRQKVKRSKCYEQFLRSSWEMGERSMNEFFTLLNEKNRKSVGMTVDVLKDRIQLEARVSNLMKKISEDELRTKELTQIQDAIRQNREKIQKCENFEFTVERVYKEKVPIENKSWRNSKATCCSVCKENCHEWGCWWVKDLSWCSVMSNNHCTVCTGKCHHSKHIREDKKYVVKTEEVKVTFKDLKLQYEHTGDRPDTSFNKEKYDSTKRERESSMKESENTTALEDKLKSNLEKIKKEKSELLHTAFISIVSLSKISLKSDSAFTLQHLDFLILRLKEEGRDEWVKILEDLSRSGEERKNKEALQYVNGCSKKKGTNQKK